MAKHGSLTLSADRKAVDPGLASLFAKSSGPVKPLPTAAYRGARSKRASEEEQPAEEEDDEELSSIDEDLPDEDEEDANENAESDEDMADVEEAESEGGIDVPMHEALTTGESEKSQRKRKRKGDHEEVEDSYMRRLAREEAKEEAKRQEERSNKRQKKEDGEAEDKLAASDEEDAASADEEDGSDASGVDPDFEVPQHESMAPSKEETELEKAARTVFLANVSTQAITSKSAKKTLIKHMSAFLSELPAHTPPHKLESLRFRSTAFSSHIPKKAAYVKKELMDATTKSTNAYVVYSTPSAAREAARRLNGTVVLERHLRVDEVAHPAKADHRRCVFVGNLGFVDDESMIQEAESERIGKQFRNKGPSDVEEGLWREFGKVGTVESVRVVRDPKTRVGKGFAYVQFTDENAVEAALLYNDKKFPPMLPRKLRVIRAKAFKRNAKRDPTTSTRPPTAKGVYNPKVSAEEKSMQGRAAKLLGRAGAAKVRSGSRPTDRRESKPANSFKSPESFVFEGHRATEKQGKSGLKLGGKKGKKGGKPTSRSSKRGTAWKAGGGKKA